MILFALAFAAIVHQAPVPKPAPPADKAIALDRVFVKGEKMQYAISSSLHTETQTYGSPIFYPSDLDMSYKFTAEVTGLKGDGIAVIHYMRPNVVQVAGETYNHGPTTTTEKLNWVYDITVSPINKILDTKDLSPKKPKAKPAGGGGGRRLLVIAPGGQQSIQAFLGSFIQEVYRLALNIGPMDSSLDFAPKLPLDDVKVGDTWKDTVGYEPQKLKGKEGKQAVQRLDYVFTYKGIVNVDGKSYHRVTAVLDLSTDLATFVNQLVDAKPEETHLKSIPLTLKQTIDYDLDLNTRRTVTAQAVAEGGFKINVTDVTSEPVQQETLKGTTTMRLLSATIVKPAKSTKGHGRENPK